MKCQHDYLKAARKVSITLFKKWRCETSSFPTFNQCKIDDSKPNTTNIRDIEDDSQAWFWTESSNESDLDSKQKGNNTDDVDDQNIGEKYSKIEGKTSSEVLKQELKWNKEREHSFCKSYKSGSRFSKKRERKSAWKLEKKGSKSYNIKILW